MTTNLPTKKTKKPRNWVFPLAIVLSAAFLLCALLIPVCISSPSEAPDPVDTTVQVDLPSGADHFAVAHLPPDVLHKLYPREHAPNLAEMWTGLGTLLLVATAILAGIFTLRQIRLERQARYAETYSTVSQRWNDAEFREVRMKIRTYFGSGGAENVKARMLALREAYDPDYWELLTALDFFENLAILVEFHALSFDMANKALGVVACQYWAMLKEFIEWQWKHEPLDEEYYKFFQDFVISVSEKRGFEIPWKDTNPPPEPGKIATKSARSAQQTYSVSGTFTGTLNGA